MYIWLDRALEYFSHLPRTEPKLQLWRDFLLWSASQLSEPMNRDLQDQIIARYGGDIRTLFMGAHRAIIAGVAEDSTQNVLLHLAVEFGVASPSPAQYAGETINQIFVQRIMDLTGKTDPDAALAAADGITIHLANCNKEYGSSMIAMANVVRNRFRGNYQEKAVFVSGGDSNEYSYLAPFIQLAIMGMPCYASPDGPIFCGNQQALFAPPSAFCSAEFFSPYWTKVRQAELRRINCPDP